MFHFEEFVKQIITDNISDIHLRLNEPPIIRKNGIMERTQYDKLTAEDMQKLQESILPKTVKNNIDNIYNFDFLYELPNISRFRINYARSLKGPIFVIRVIPYEAPKFQDKRIPNTLENVCNYSNGIVFVTGPTGCGKSTTLTAMLEHINNTQSKHIITLEDPVEFLYTNKKSLFSQRSIGNDAEDFPSAVKAALRQDPDIILIGEIRDKYTAKEALSAAETGHLVFTTMHTTDTVQTINRIVNLFEPHERSQVREQLAEVLRATIAQKLVVTADNMSRIPAFEILISTPTIKDYIIKDELEQLYHLIKEGRYADMITLNLYLATLVKENLITEAVALNASENKEELLQIFKGKFSLGNKNLKLFSR